MADEFINQVPIGTQRQDENDNIGLLSGAAKKEPYSISVNEKGKVSADFDLTTNAGKIMAGRLSGASDSQILGKHRAIDDSYNYDEALNAGVTPTEILNDFIKRDVEGDPNQLNPAQQTTALKLSDDFEAASTDFFKQRAAIGRVEASAADPSPAGDLALIFNYMKVLDPNSVVRESEFATAANTGSVDDRTRALYNKVVKGTRLSATQRQDFLDRSRKLATKGQENQNLVIDNFTGKAKRFGVPADTIVRTATESGQQRLEQGGEQGKELSLAEQTIQEFDKLNQPESQSAQLNQLLQKMTEEEAPLEERVKVANQIKAADIEATKPPEVLPTGKTATTGKEGTEPEDVVKQGRTKVEKVAGFLGIEKLGQGIGLALFQATPEFKQLEKLASEGKISQEEFESITTEGLTGKEVAGSAALTGLNVAAPGATKGAGLLAKVGKSAAVGAGFGAAGAVERGGDVEDVKSGVKTGALLGGALPVAGKAISKVTEKFTKNLPVRIFNTAIKPSLDDTRKSITFGGKTLGEELLDRGVKGSDKKILKTATNEIASNEKKLQSVLENSKEFINKREILEHSSIKSLRKLIKDTPGIGGEAKAINEVLKDLPLRLSLSKANIIKRNITNQLRDVAFKLDPSLSGKKKSMKATASALRELIENKSGSEEVKSLNKNLGVFIKTKDGIIDKFARDERNQILGLGNIGTGTAGAAAGGLPGAVGLLATKAALGTTTVKTRGATILRKIGKVIDKLPTDKAGNVSKKALFNLINEMKEN